MSAELRLIDQAEADRLFRERTNPEAEGPVHFPEFQGAHLRDVTLHMSALAGPVNFSRSVLERVHLRGSNLDDAGFDQTRLTDCDLSHLNGARLWAEGAVFEGCDFTQSYLRRSHFKSARLERCDLTQAELAASFAVSASFRGCVLDRTDFDLAWLDSADFTDTRCRETVFRRAHMRSAKLPGVDVRGCDFADFKDLKHKYADWVLDPLKYDSIENLLLVFEPAILAPALEKHAELTARKARELVTRDVRSYLPQNRKP